MKTFFSILSIMMVAYNLSYSQYDYSDCTNDNNPCPRTPSGNFNISGQAWAKSLLKYYFVNGTSDIEGDIEKTAFEYAFQTWSAVVPFEFIEVYNSNEADIKIHFCNQATFNTAYGRESFDYAASFSPERTCHGLLLINDEHWRFSMEQYPANAIDLVYVALHEMGHILGLCHSNNAETVMYKEYIANNHSRNLHSYDIEGIQSIYDRVTVKNEFKNPDGLLVNGGIVNAEVIPGIYQNYNTDNLPNQEKTFAFNQGSQRRFEAKEQTFHDIDRKFNPFQDFNGGWILDDLDPVGFSQTLNTNVVTGTYKARYRYKTNIGLTAITEFNGIIATGLTIGQIFQYEDGLINAPSSYQPSGSNINYKFSFWSDDFTAQNPRIINPIENETYTSLYKYPHHFNAGSFTNSGQRKVIKCDYGYLHLVYESMGYVWYERSTNNGATWHIMNGGKPIDKNPSKSPSIDFYYGYQRLVIVYQTWQEIIVSLQLLKQLVSQMVSCSLPLQFMKVTYQYTLK